MQTEEEDEEREVSSPFTASLKCSAKNTCLSTGRLAREWSSSHLIEEEKTTKQQAVSHLLWEYAICGHDLESSERQPGGRPATHQLFWIVV